MGTRVWAASGETEPGEYFMILDTAAMQFSVGERFSTVRLSGWLTTSARRGRALERASVKAPSPYWQQEQKKT
jgi:hypothetical protein